MAAEKVGQLFDSRGIALNLDEGDLVTDVVAIAKVVKADGAATIVFSTSDGTDWITRRGLVGAAHDVFSAVAAPLDDED